MSRRINDTVRELGSALGIAVFGSLVAARYSDRVAEVIPESVLPEGMRATAMDGIGGALVVSETLGDRGADVAAAAQQAFLGAMTVGLWWAAALTVTSAGVALVAAHHRSGQAVNERLVPSATVPPSL